jgi:hypothetical protein
MGSEEGGSTWAAGWLASAEGSAEIGRAVVLYPPVVKDVEKMWV